MRFRASWTVLSAWERGDYERAVAMYFKIADFMTKAMEQGREWHKKWQEEVNATGCMPKVFGGSKLVKPQTELKIEKQLDDWLELVGVIDLLDNGVIFDWKTGFTESDRYADSAQPKVYKLLYPKAERAEIHHYNQYTGKSDMSIVYLGSRAIDEAVNWVVTLGGEMHDYLQKNKLYERFAKK